MSWKGHIKFSESNRWLHTGSPKVLSLSSLLVSNTTRMGIIKIKKNKEKKEENEGKCRTRSFSDCGYSTCVTLAQRREEGKSCSISLNWKAEG